MRSSKQFQKQKKVSGRKCLNGDREENFEFHIQMFRWTKSHELLTELDIKKDDLSQIVEEASIALR